MTAHHNTRICIYARASTSCHTNRDFLLAEQVERLKAWCRRKGAIIVDTVIETESGTHQRGSGFQAMLAAAISDRRPYDAILVTSFSRMLRNPATLVKDLEMLDRAKVRVLSISSSDHLLARTASTAPSDE
jgi:DNA invertase Pin-like site-specific DNA recombinase